jgi:signal transduction histidine kinase
VRVSLQDCSGPGAPGGAGVNDPVRLSVQDSGPGVKPEHMARIFDPFFTTREGGSGLGLAVVHRAVKAHEGTLFVEDATDGGAHFLVYLPGTHVVPASRGAAS